MASQADSHAAKTAVWAASPLHLIYVAIEDNAQNAHAYTSFNVCLLQMVLMIFVSAGRDGIARFASTLKRRRY
ncbi:MAG: hypothetical protein AAGL19_17985, partial [Pseudomonadota bacterium]